MDEPRMMPTPSAFETNSFTQTVVNVSEESDSEHADPIRGVKRVSMICCILDGFEIEEISASE